CAGGAGIENDEFSSQRKERDEHHGLYLDDARAPKSNSNNRMLKFHGDEQRHDHAKERLEDLMFQWIYRTAEQQRLVANAQLHERQCDDHRDYETQNDRNNLFEALVNGHDRPMLTGFRKELSRCMAFAFHLSLRCYLRWQTPLERKDTFASAPKGCPCLLAPNVRHERQPAGGEADR